MCTHLVTQQIVSQHGRDLRALTPTMEIHALTSSLLRPLPDSWEEDGAPFVHRKDNKL